MKHSLAFVLVFQLALVTITTCAMPPTFRKNALRTAQHNATEWADILKSIQPLINNSFASSIVQNTSTSKVVNNINPYVISGSAAALGQFPWQGRFTSDYFHICGCSLIREDLCLTAAHCVIGVNLVVVLGSISQRNPSAGHVVVNVAEAIKHPFFGSSIYSKHNITYDIAILKFASNVALTANIGLVKLPSLSDVNFNFTGTSATLSGFNEATDEAEQSSVTLQYLQVTVVPNYVCAAFRNYVRDSHLCTWNTNNGRCIDDAGSSLVIKDSSNTYVLIGILSMNYVDACHVEATVFVSTTAYLDWISTTIASITATTTTVTTASPTTTTTAAGTTNTTKSINLKTTTTTKISTRRTTITTTKRPTTTKFPICAEENFLTMAKCCDILANPILIISKGDKTCKIEPTKIKIFNTYYLNKLQIMKRNNTIDVKDEKTKKTIAKDACFVYCILNDVGAMNDDGTFNLDILKDFVALNQMAWKESVPAIVDACMLEVENYAPPSVTAGKETCPSTGAFMMQCIQFAFIKACPSSILSPSCTKNKKSFDKCSETIMQGMYSMSAITVVKKLPHSSIVEADENQKSEVKASKNLVAKTAVK